MMEATIQPSLQWSHRLSAVVTGRLDSVPDEEKGLQWSHRLSAVETSPSLQCPCHIATERPSMEPPPFGSGKTRMSALQWSHRLSAVETTVGTALRYRAPSMEPPPFGSGNWIRSFNGATAFRQWRALHQSSILQWSHRLSAVETPTGCAFPPPFGCQRRRFFSRSGLQWSHRLSAVETVVRTVGRQGNEPPSAVYGGGGRTRRSRPFNGATAFRQWKLPHACTLQWSHRLQWKLPTTIGVFRLQWSHRLSAVETSCQPLRATALQWTIAFNGATAFRQWKRLEAGAILTFNGATAFRQWKPCKESDGLAHLQWSHRLSAVETWKHGRQQPTPSMEPPPFGSGNG